MESKNSIELEEIASIELDRLTSTSSFTTVTSSGDCRSSSSSAASCSTATTAATTTTAAPAAANTVNGNQSSTNASAQANASSTTSSTPTSSSSSSAAARATAAAFAERVRAASAAVTSGDLTGAVRLYTEALKLDSSTNAHILYGNRSAAYCRLGKYKRALQDAIKARQLNPSWSKAYYRQGMALQCQRDYADALAAFASGLATDAQSVQLLTAFVETAMKSPLRASLEPIYRQLQVMRTLSPFVITSVVGQELLAARHYAAAAVVLESALQIGTSSLKLRGSVLSALSSAYWAMNKLDVAIRYMQEDLQVASSLTDSLGECRAHGNLGSAYFAKCNYKEALTAHRYQLVLAMKAGHTEQAVLALTALGHVYSAIGDLKNALSSHQRCLQLITAKLGDPLAEAREIGNVGAVHLASGEAERAIECHLEHVKLAKLLGNKAEEARAYSNLGSAYHYRRHYEQAIQFHEQVLRLSQEIGDRTIESKAYAGLGHAARCMGDHLQAKRWYDRQLDVALSSKDRAAEARACSNLGVVYQLLGDFDGALKLHWSALNIGKALGDSGGIGRAYGNIGNAYSALRQYDEAIRYHKLELAVSREVHDRGAEATTHGNLGLAYQALGGRDQQALTHFHLHLGIAEEMKDATGEANALLNLGNYHCARRQWDLALGFYERYAEKTKTRGTQGGGGGGDKEAEAKANHLLGWTLYSMGGDYERAVGHFEADLALSKELQDRPSIGRAYCHLALAKMELPGRLEEALEAAKYYLCAAGEGGTSSSGGGASSSTASGSIGSGSSGKLRALGIIAEVLRRQGKWAEAMRTLEKQLTVARSLGELAAEAAIFGAMGSVQRSAGAFEEAARHYKQELIFRQGAADLQAEIAALENLGDCYGKQGNHTLALKCFLEQLERCEQRQSATALPKLSSSMAEGLFSENNNGISSEHYDADTGYYGRRTAGTSSSLSSSSSSSSLSSRRHQLSRHLDALREHLEACQQAVRAAHNVASTRFHMSQYEEAIGFYEKEARMLEGVIPLAEASIAGVQQQQQQPDGVQDGQTSGQTTSTSTTTTTPFTSTSTLTAISSILEDLRLKRVAVARWIGDCHFARAAYSEAIRQYLAFLAASSSLMEQEQVHCLLGKCYQLVGSLAQALVSYEKRLVLAHEIGCNQTKAIAYGELGHIHRLLGNYEQAISCFKHEQELAKEVARTGEQKSICESGQQQQQQSKNIQPLTTTNQKPTVNVGLVIEAEALHGLGCVAHEMHDYERALKYHASALTIAQERLNSLELQSRAYGAMGAAYVALGNFESATRYQEKHLAVAGMLGDLTAQVAALSSLGKVHSSRSQFRAAAHYLQLALDIVEKADGGGFDGGVGGGGRREEEEARLCYELGMSLWAVNDLQTAEHHLRRSVDLIESLHQRTMNGGSSFNGTSTSTPPHQLPQLSPYNSSSIYGSICGSAHSTTSSSSSNSSTTNPSSSHYAQFQWSNLLSGHHHYHQHRKHYHHQLVSPLHQHLHVQGASYEALAKILIALGRPTEALLIAERSRTRLFSSCPGGAAKQQQQGFKAPLLGALTTAEQLVALARGQKAAILYYSATADGSYNAWLITPRAGVRFSPLVKSAREKVRALLAAVQAGLLQEDKSATSTAERRAGRMADCGAAAAGDDCDDNDDACSQLSSSPTSSSRSLHHLNRNHFLNSSNYSLSSLFSLASSVASASTSASTSRLSSTGGPHHFSRVHHRSSAHSIKSHRSYTSLVGGGGSGGGAGGSAENAIRQQQPTYSSSSSSSTHRAMKRSSSSPAVARNRAQQARHHWSTTAAGSSSLAALYELLVGPFQDGLDEESSLSRLLLVLDGDLFLVPWSMLRAGGGSAGDAAGGVSSKVPEEYLSERYSLLVVPSLNVLRGEQRLKTLLRRTPSSSSSAAAAGGGGISEPFSSLVVANPTMPSRQESPSSSGHHHHRSAPLFYENPASSREAAFVGELLSTKPLIGPEASKAGLLEQLSAAQCIHFSSYIIDNTGGDPLKMATGLGIAISPSDVLIGDSAHQLHDDEYLLTPHDLISVGLSAKLVVISCCALSPRSSSGTSSASSPGHLATTTSPTFSSSQALKTITSALLQAGASCVLLALWPVPLPALQTLFRIFYCSLLQGARVSAALSEAVSSIQNTGHFAHPRNWACWQLIGSDVRLRSQAVAALSSSLAGLLETPERSRDAMRVVLHLVEKSLQRSSRGQKNAMYTTLASIEAKVGGDRTHGWRQLLMAVGFRFEPSSASGTPACVFFPQHDPSGRLMRASTALQAALALSPATIHAVMKLVRGPFAREAVQQLTRMVQAAGGEEEGALKSQHGSYYHYHHHHQQQQYPSLLSSSYLETVNMKLWSAPGCHELYASLGFDLMEVGASSVTLRSRTANLRTVLFALQTMQALEERDEEEEEEEEEDEKEEEEKIKSPDAETSSFGLQQQQPQQLRGIYGQLCGSKVEQTSITTTTTTSANNNNSGSRSLYHHSQTQPPQPVHQLWQSPSLFTQSSSSSSYNSHRGEPDGQQVTHSSGSAAGSRSSSSDDHPHKPSSLEIISRSNSSNSDSSISGVPCSRGAIGRSLLDSELIEEKLKQMTCVEDEGKDDEEEEEREKVVPIPAPRRTAPPFFNAVARYNQSSASAIAIDRQSMSSCSSIATANTVLLNARQQLNSTGLISSRTGQHQFQQQQQHFMSTELRH